MKTSAVGIALIKQFEGFSAIPYRDVVGKMTIGFGHLIKPGEVFGAVSSIEATSLLIKDVGFAEDCINKNVTAELDQNQFDALCSFVYNLGCANFLSSTLLKYVNLYNFELAAAEFGRWNHAGGKSIAGLTRRRAAEAALFEK
jgi:GH24 family phage-related lysozyme (muramidase)